jgi:hypothetical protein
VFLQCMCMSKEDSACEPENPKVRGKDGIANQSGPIGFSHEFTASNSTFPRQSPSKTTSHHGDYPFGHSLPTAIPGKLLRQPRNLVIVEFILSSPILFTAGIHFRLFFSTTKVCSDSLNLSNAGDSFAGISSLISCYLFSRTRDLIAMF